MSDSKGVSKNYELNSEVIILASVIADPKLLYKTYSRISEKLFYRGDHRAIWNAISLLYENNKVIDIVSVVNTIETERLYGSPLKNLVEEICDTIAIPNIETLNHHINIVVEMYMIRQKEQFANRILIKTQRKTKYSELVEIAGDYNVIFIDDQDGREFKPKNLKEIIHELNKDSAEAIEEGVNKTRGLSTGFSTIDQMFLLRKQNVYCIAARPAMGKTSLVLQICLNAAQAGFRVLFFSLEMSQEEILEKIMSVLHDMTNDDIRSLSEPELMALRNKTAKYLNKELPNFIIDDYATSLQEIKSSTYDVHRTGALDLVAIDYLQLIDCESKDENRNQELTKISRTIKTQIAKRLNVPVIVLSQLNRGVENRNDKRPELKDLRESGAIEQDMTMVMFLYRDEYYDIEIDRRGRFTKNITELIVKKNRFGKSPDKKRIRFIAPYTKFEDLPVTERNW